MKITEQQLHKIATDLVNELAKSCPVDTAMLKNSIWYEIDNGDIVISMKNYGMYVEFGTLAHVIEPVNKKALSWKSDGGRVFAKRVFHPGTKPQPFIRPTMKHKLPMILKRRLS